jgi:hypothetical protein
VKKGELTLDTRRDFNEPVHSDASRGGA